MTWWILLNNPFKRPHNAFKNPCKFKVEQEHHFMKCRATYINWALPWSGYRIACRPFAMLKSSQRSRVTEASHLFFLIFQSFVRLLWSPRRLRLSFFRFSLLLLLNEFECFFLSLSGQFGLCCRTHICLISLWLSFKLILYGVCDINL